MSEADLSIIIKTLLQATESDTKTQLEDIQRLVNKQEPIKVLFNFDKKSVDDIKNNISSAIKTVDGKKIANEIAEYFGIVSGKAKKELIEVADKFTQGLIPAKKLMEETLEISAKYLKSIGESTDEWRNVYEYIKNSSVFVSKTINELDSKNFNRNGVPANWNTKGKTSIDTWYEEANEKFPNLFPIDITNIEQQLEQVVEVYHAAKENIKQSSMTADEIVSMWGGKEDIEIYFRNVLGKHTGEAFSKGLSESLEKTEEYWQSLFENIPAKEINEIMKSAVSVNQELEKSFLAQKDSLFSNEGFDSAQHRLEEIRRTIDSLAQIKIDTTIDENGIEKITKATLEYKTEAGNAATEVMKWVGATSELNGEMTKTNTFETVSVSYVDNIEKQQNVIAEAISLQEKLTEKLLNLSKGSFSQTDINHFDNIATQIKEISVDSKDAIERLSALGDEISNVITRSKSGIVVDMGSLNFKSSHDEIVRQIATLKELNEEQVQVSEKGKSLFTDKSTGEQFRILTLTVEETKGRFREYALSVSDLTDQFRLLDNGLVNVNSNLAQKENVLMARLQNQINNFQTDMNAKIGNLKLGDISDTDTETLDKLASEINAITIETENAEQKMRQFNTAFRELSADIKRGRLVDENPLSISIGSSNEDLQNYIANLKGVNEAQVQIQNSSKMVFGNNAEQIRIVNALVSNGADGWNRYQYAINATNGQVRELDKGLKETSESANNIAGVLSTVLVATGITRGLKEIIKFLQDATIEAIAFESALAGVRKTTDFTSSEMEVLRKQLLGLSTEIPLTASELAGIAETAGQIGIEKDNIIDYTRIMANLGAATSLTGEEAATMIARFANITQMPQSDFDRLSSSIVKLGNDTAATEKEIADMLLRLASSGKQAGMSNADMVGLSAALVSLGVGAEMGGTAYSKGINAINIAVSTGNENLKDFARIAGMSAEEFKKAWEINAANAMVAFTEGLADVERHGSNTIVLLEELGFTEVRLSDTLRRAAGSGELLRDAIIMSNEAWEENVALANEAEVRYATTESKIQLLSNATNQLKIAIGDALTPTLNAATEGLAGFALGSSELLTQNRLITGAFAALVTLIGTAVGVLTLYTVAIKALTAAKTVFTATTGIATTSLKAFLTTMVGSPLGKFVIALSAVSAIIATVTFAMSESNRVQEEAQIKAQEAARALAEQSKSLEDTKTKVNELRKALDSGNLSQGEAYDKRKELYDIQSRLIEQYGKEAHGIDLVTGSINEQIESLGESIYRNFVQENKNAIDASVKYFEEFEKQIQTINTRAANGFDQYKEILEELGMSLDYAGGTYNIQYYLEAVGTPDEILSNYRILYNEIDGLSKEATGNEKKYAEAALEVLSELISSKKAEYEKHASAYQEYIEGLIKYDKRYASEYSEILTAKSALQKAQLDGDERAILESQSKLIDIFNATMERAAKDPSALNAFKLLFEELQAQFGKWKFEIDLGIDADSVAENIKSRVENILKALPDTDIDILALDDNMKQSQQHAAYVSLKKVAEEYGMTIEELIKVLVQYDLVQGRAAETNEKPTATTRELSEVLKETSSSISLLSTAQKEMTDNDEISLSTLQKLIESGLNYNSFLDTSTGKLRLNTEALKEKIIADLEDEKIQKEKSIQSQKDIIFAAYEEQVIHGRTSATWETIDAAREKIASDKESIAIIDTMIASVKEEASEIRNLNEELNNIKSAYNTLADAVDEHNKQGYISIDTLNKILALGDDYLHLLYDENGQLKLNKEALEALAYAQLEELEITTLRKHLDLLTSLKDEETATNYLSDATGGLTSELSNLNNEMANTLSGMIATGEISEDVADKWLKQADAIRATFAATRTGIGQGSLRTSSSSSSKSTPTQKPLDTSNQFEAIMRDFEKRLEPIDREIEKIQSQISQAEAMGNTDLVSSLTFGLVKAQEQRKTVLEQMLTDTQSITTKINSTFREFANVDMSDYGIAKYRQNLSNQITSLQNANVNNANDDRIKALESTLTRFNEFISAYQAGQQQLNNIQSQIDKSTDDIFMSNMRSADSQSQMLLDTYLAEWDKRAVSNEQFISNLEALLSNKTMSGSQRDKITNELQKFFDDEYSRNKNVIAKDKNLLLPDDFEGRLKNAIDNVRNAEAAIARAKADGFREDSSLMDSLQSDLFSNWTDYYDTQLKAAQDALDKTGNHSAYQERLNGLLNDGNAELINKLSVINALDESSQSYYKTELDYINRELDLYKKNSGFDADPLQIIEYLDKVKVKAHEAANALREELLSAGWEKDLIEFHPDIINYSNIWWSAEDEQKAQKRNIAFAEFDLATKNTAIAIGELDRQLSQLSDTDVDKKAELITEKIKLQEAEIARIIPRFDVLRKLLKDGAMSESEFADEVDNLNKSLFENTRSIQENKIAQATLEQDSAINRTSDAVESLNFQMKLMADSDYDRKMAAVTKQLELENKTIDLNAEKLKNINELYGDLSPAEYEQAVKNVTNAWQDSVLAAQALEKQLVDLQIAQMNVQLSQLNEQKSAINTIVDMVKNLIKQEAADEIKALNDEIENLNNQKKALNDIEKDLNNALKERNNLDKDRKKVLDDELKRQRELAKEVAKNIDDELKKYKEIIDAKKKALDLDKEAYDYNRQLNDKQSDISKLEQQIAELSNDTSRQGVAQKLRLEEELAKKQQDLTDFTYGHEIDARKDALDEEYDAFKRMKDNEKDIVDQQLADYEKNHESKIEMMDAEREAYENSINAQIEALKLRGEEYDAQSERIKGQIQDIQDGIANNGELTRQAMARIDQEGDALYQKLVDWNHVYGTGIEEDVMGAWQNYLDLVDRGNQTTLEHTRQIYRDILDVTRQIADAQASISNLSASGTFSGNIGATSSNNLLSGTYDPGIRKYFEEQGYDVDWNDNTKQFSVSNGGKTIWFDSKEYENLNGRLQASYEQLLRLEQQLSSIPGFSSGGYIKKDTLAIVHGGERILNSEETKKYDEGESDNLKIEVIKADAETFGKLLDSKFGQYMIRDNFQKQWENTLPNNNYHDTTNNVNHALSVNIEKIESNYHGITPESFVKDVDRRIEETSEKVGNEVINNLSQAMYQNGFRK